MNNPTPTETSYRSNKETSSPRTTGRLLARRSFLHKFAIATAAVASSTCPDLVPSLRAQAARTGNPLRLPPDWSGDTLSVAAASLNIWPGYSTAVSAINGSVPGPTIRVRRGQEFRTRIHNQLARPLELHWHGLLAPERMNGHPRDAVAAGESYEVRFPVNQPASTCWYHAHTDQYTGEQVYRGVAGLFIIEDPEETSLGLPSGDHDVPLVLADKRTDAQRQLVYAPSMMDAMTGYLGDLVLVNGTPDAWLSVDRGLYRFRLLNGSNARIYKVTLDDAHPFDLIGTDGGLLPSPVRVTSAMIAPGQRLEILVDFATYMPGASLALKSASFPAPAGMMGGPSQGVAMGLLRFYVDRPASIATSVPPALVPFTPYNRAQAQRTRVFTLAARGMVHTINGQLFDIQRLDYSVPLGDLEIWEYRNTSNQFHPMHVHAAHFQVIDRSSVATLPLEDTGWKDTVLVNPNETVRLLVRFNHAAGVFVHHCHNLEHEDEGMMQNFEVLAPPALDIQRQGTGVTISWPGLARGYGLESCPSLGFGADWQPVIEKPANVNGQWTVTITEPTGHRFYRLVKN